MALKSRGLVGHVVGVGRNRERLELAAKLGAIDSWSTDLSSSVRDADLVYISTPVGLELDFIRQVSEWAKSGCVITDAGSTKGMICRGADEILGDANCFVGGHPMAGSEATGVDAANPDLFVNATYVLTPSAKTNPEAVDRMREISEKIGSRVLVMPPDAHDRCAAVISHLPHLIAAALVSLAKEHSLKDPQVFDLIAGSFRDMTRVASSSPVLWRDICLTNTEGIESAAETFKRLLDQGVDFLKTDDSSGFEEWFAESKKVRDTLFPSSKNGKT
jgi:prephenate dehydrogenase